MKNLTATICLAVALLIGSAGVSWSQDYQKGLAAAESGDFATALREWTPLAKQGYADAQSNLALMYKEGQGVIQDNVYAHMWWNIGAMTGAEMSTMFRDSVEEEMTSSQLAEARKLARECVRKNYKGC